MWSLKVSVLCANAKNGYSAVVGCSVLEMQLAQLFGGDVQFL